VDRSGKLAYAPNSGSNNVSAYTIDATTGALAAVAGSPFAAGTFPCSVAITGAIE
jgi:6-phosphogluconolactonase (cycloisomerase 2 family)